MTELLEVPGPVVRLFKSAGPFGRVLTTVVDYDDAISRRMFQCSCGHDTPIDAHRCAHVVAARRVLATEEQARVEAHLASTMPCPDCNDGYHTDQNGARWKCGTCRGMSRVPACSGCGRPASDDCSVECERTQVAA